MANFTEETISVAGGNLQVYKGGSGDPLLVLHGAGGNAGPRRYAHALAERFTVYLPSHPGYGKSDRPGWVESMQDLACFYTWYQEQEGLENVPRYWVLHGRLAGCGNAVHDRPRFQQGHAGGRCRHQAQRGRDHRHLHHQPRSDSRSGLSRPQPGAGMGRNVRLRPDAGTGRTGRRRPGKWLSASLGAPTCTIPGCRPS